MAILIPKILRYSFKQAPNDKCGVWALADWSPVARQVGRCLGMTFLGPV